MDTIEKIFWISIHLFTIAAMFGILHMLISTFNHTWRYFHPKSFAIFLGTLFLASFTFGLHLAKLFS